MPSLAKKYGNDIINLSYELLKINNKDIQRNVAFLLGIICESAPSEMGSKYVEIMQKLQHMLEPSFDKFAKDNAIAAVCRMI